MKMNEKQLARWEKLRKMGRTRFIWLYGVLAWGVSVGVMWALGMTAANGDWERLPVTLGIALVGFPIGGYFFGALMWKMSEAAYRKAVEEKEQDGEEST
jgi:hypothetical protein